MGVCSKSTARSGLPRSRSHFSKSLPVLRSVTTHETNAGSGKHVLSCSEMH